MHSPTLLTLIVSAFLLGWLGTIAMERLAPRFGLVRSPNARSSHIIPTARGGGLAIASASVLAALLLAASGNGLHWIALLTAAIAALGFVDDLRELSPGLRFPIQIAIMTGLVWMSWPLPRIVMTPDLAIGSWALAITLVLIGLWWLNLFNFMDGIDGIAGSQAVLLLTAGSGLWWSADPLATTAPPFWLALAGAAATVGFLCRNWPPARIFMGDAGSNALALLIFAIALISIGNGALGYPCWLILPSIFVTDASVTLLRRLVRGERPWHAHRRHAYQQVSRLWGHQKVTLLYCGLTLFWATPLAFAAQHLQFWAWWLVPIAYMPLVALALRADAGGVGETARA